MIIIFNIRIEVILDRRVAFVILELKMRIILNVGLVLEKWLLFFLSLAQIFV